MPCVIEHTACIVWACQSDCSSDAEVAIEPAEATLHPDLPAACRRLLADA